MSDLSELFMSASRTLRDELVIELKKQNDFLRKQAASSIRNKDILMGAKVIVEHPDNASRFRPNTEGIIVSHQGINALVLMRDIKGDVRATTIYFGHLKIQAPWFDKLLDDQ